MTETSERVAATVATDWLVYIILCSDGSLYTGITTDLERRLTQHANGRGAKYFRGRAPGPVVYVERGHDRGSASRREAAIKRMTPAAKRRLIGAHGTAARAPAGPA